MAWSGCEAIPTDSASSIQNQLCWFSRRSASDSRTSRQRPATVSSRVCAAATARAVARHDAGGAVVDAPGGAGSSSVSEVVALAVSGVTLLVVLRVDIDTP